MNKSERLPCIQGVILRIPVSLHGRIYIYHYISVEKAKKQNPKSDCQRMVDTTKDLSIVFQTLRGPTTQTPKLLHHFSLTRLRSRPRKKHSSLAPKHILTVQRPERNGSVLTTSCGPYLILRTARGRGTDVHHSIEKRILRSLPCTVCHPKRDHPKEPMVSRRLG